VVAQQIDEGFDGTAIDYLGDAPPGFDKLAQKYRCDFINANAREYVSLRKQDLTFIDTNTRYRGMRKIYKLATTYSKFVAFHDITDRRWGAKKIWARIKARNPGQTVEFVHKGPGIGVVRAPFL